jgi:formyl-CoA transferase
MVSDHIRKRTGSILEGVSPSNVYPCSDGEYLIGGNQDAVFARLAQAMGRPELARDERYATHVARGRNLRELDDIIADWTRTLTVEELEALMVEHSVPAGKIYRAPEMLEDPHFAAREALVEVESDRWGKFKMQNSFPKLSDTPSSIRSLAPAEIGQDNAEIYGGLLGFDDAEIARLKDAKAI